MNFVVKWTAFSFNINGNRKFQSYEEAKRFKQEIHDSAFTLGISLPIDIRVEIED